MKELNIKQEKKTSFVKSMDLIGGKFHLGFESSTGAFQTKLGGLITLALGVTSLGFLVHIVSQYMDTESPIVNTSTELNQKSQSFDLYQEDLYLMLIFSNAFGFIENYQRFVTPKLRVYDLIYNSTKKSYDIKKIQEYDYVNCNQITDQKILQVGKLSHTHDDLTKLALCPDFGGDKNEFSIGDDLESFVYRRAELALYPCSLGDSTQCASPQEFLHFTTYYTKMNKLLTPSNFEKPMTYAPTIGDIILNPYFSKFMKFAVYGNKIVDTKYEFVEAQVKQEYANYEVVERDFNPRNSSQLHCSKKQVNMWKWGGCSEYLSIVYEVKRELFIVRRRYKRITDVFAEFGGIMKLLTASVFFLYSWYNKASIRSSIISSTFGSSEKESAEVKEFVEFLNSKNEKKKIEQKSEFHGENEIELSANSVDKDLNFVPKKAIMRPSKTSKTPAKPQAKLTPQDPEDFLEENDHDNVDAKNSFTQFALQRTNANDLIEKLNFVEFLQMIFLDQNCKKLIPLALIKARHDKQRSSDAARLKEGAKEKKSANQVIEPSWMSEQKEENVKDTESNAGTLRDSVRLTTKLSSHSRHQTNRNKVIPHNKYYLKNYSQRKAAEMNRDKQSQIQNDGPSSLSSAYSDLKDSQADPSCSVRSTVKSYLIEQIGGFFDQKNRLKPVFISKSSTELKSADSKFKAEAQLTMQQDIAHNDDEPETPQIHRKKLKAGKWFKKRLKKSRFSRPKKKRKCKLKESDSFNTNSKGDSLGRRESIIRLGQSQREQINDWQDFLAD